MVEKQMTREELLNKLEIATKELQKAKAVKKQEAKAHNNHIGDIEDEIDGIMDELSKL